MGDIHKTNMTNRDIHTFTVKSMFIYHPCFGAMGGREKNEENSTQQEPTVIPFQNSNRFTTVLVKYGRFSDSEYHPEVRRDL